MFHHKFKCLSCGLHFTVCSDFKEWPKQGTTREQQVGEATGKCYCPECGRDEEKLHWREENPQPIFMIVPGYADSLGLGRPGDR